MRQRPTPLRMYPRPPTPPLRAHIIDYGLRPTVLTTSLEGGRAIKIPFEPKAERTFEGGRAARAIPCEPRPRGPRRRPRCPRDQDPVRADGLEDLEGGRVSGRPAHDEPQTRSVCRAHQGR